MAKVILAAAIGAILAASSAVALAEEQKLLDIEPLSSDELLAEKGEILDSELQAGADEPRRRRATAISGAVATSGQGNTVLVRSRSSGQINSSSLNATNNLTSISNIAGNAGNGG